ncbi:6-phosphogluconolactonase [Rubrobacter aplysinae]|uniref:6-phosphogluconolactonase n=1 Tax=Rubrobacter aplysinae TaxID=909625 RepID=UPI00064C0A55|nr:6-phosphogluconolactonase [Rubrobacter aplysinae]
MTGYRASIHDGPRELAREAARRFVETAEAAVAEKGFFTVALAGGSTPEATYHELARDYADRPLWGSTHVFFGDERTVPPEDEDSNYRMARETLLDYVQTAGVYRMKGELTPEMAAAEYERDLQGFFGGDTPVFDLILLGVGPDGHTASLFPGTPALDVRDRLAAANPVEKLDTDRLTLTVPVLNAARAVWFLVAGEDKAEAVAEVLEGDADPHEYPSKLVRPDDGGPVWMLDREAASGLTG